MSEIAGKAAFDEIRYAQCWEDADTLLAALSTEPGDRCLAIASAGDNCLSMLTADPASVLAVDLNPAQLHCLALRVAAYRCLEHPELLELVGSRPSDRRVEFYRRCRSELADGARIFWDRRLPAIAAGIGSSGRFERYFALFRKRLLPWIHGQGRIDELLQPRGLVDRRRFFDERWSTLAWRALFKVFFSRLVMGRCGRDPAFFDYVEGSVADRILARSRHALRELDPSVNPYLHWILKGCHGEALPLALRAEHFDTIRNRLDRLNWRQTSIEGALAQGGVDHFDRYNLSDIFEYMSPLAARTLLERLHEAGRDGGRLVYWNMLVPRQRPAALADRLESLDGRGLLAEDKAWFYSALRIERVHKAP